MHLSRKAIAEYLQISWDTVGPMITRVEQELSAGRSRFDGLVNIAIDETSYKKGHKYLTLILNHDTNAVVWAGKGYGKAVLEQFFTLLTRNNANESTLYPAMALSGSRTLYMLTVRTQPSALIHSM